MPLSNTVFQGTVLGPCLWNIFFADIQYPVRQSGAEEAVFADDMNAFREFDNSVTNHVVMETMRQCQAAVHNWGIRNQAVFEPTKEQLAVLHHIQGDGLDFKLLGVTFDAKLNVNAAVDSILREAGPKLKALLRTSHYYDHKAMMKSYKAHVLCLLEGANSAVYHASSSTLERLENLQRSFLRHLSLTESEAFLVHNLAPLSLRRDIGMLGLLFKCINGLAHPGLCDLFRLSGPLQYVHNTRTATARHDLQIDDVINSGHINMFRHSLYGLVRVWNLLPSDIVHAASVSCFQSALTALAKRLCKHGSAHWRCRFSPRSTHHVLMLR